MYYQKVNDSRKMFWVLSFIVVALSATSVADLNNPYLPRRLILDRDLEATGIQTVLCRLPPYPERGGYVIVDKPNAKPGDLIYNASLTQYKSDSNDVNVIIQAYQCTAGGWSMSVFKYQTEELYFNTSWCPLLCPSLMDNYNAKAPTLAPAIISYTLEEETSGNKSCILPPYPARGGYFMLNQPDAKVKPGDVYDRLVTLVTYRMVYGTELFKVNVLVRNEGV